MILHGYGYLIVFFYMDSLTAYCMRKVIQSPYYECVCEQETSLNSVLTLCRDNHFYKHLKISFRNSNVPYIPQNTFNFGFESLRHLHLVGIKLTALPDNIFNILNRLETLDLHNNTITTISKLALNIRPNNYYDYNHRTNNLNYLDLSYNSITFIDSDSFKNMKNLKNLNLSRNKLISLSPIFLNTKSLKVLDLSNNNFKDIPNLSGLNFLQTLNLSYNNIHTANFETSFNVDSVDLSYNNISFSQFDRINTMYLSHNNLRMDINIHSFHQVDLKGIDSTRVIQYFYVSSVSIFDLSFNNIDDINEKFKIYEESIKLSSNNTKTLDVFMYIQKINMLNLSHNNLVDINREKYKFEDSNSTDLVNIYIGVAKIINHNKHLKISGKSSSLYYGEFTFHIDINTIKNLILQYRNITEVSFELFDGLSNLEFLDLSNNKITTLSGTAHFPNLTVIHLNNNQIFELTFNISAPKMQELILSFNKISSLENVTIKSNLLDLSNNEIILDKEFSTHISKVAHLSLAYNKLDNLDVGKFKYLNDLKSLNLSHNDIKTLRIGSFKGLNNLISLDLSYNEISDLTVQSLHMFTKLKDLHIDFNNLSNIESALHILPSLHTISLGGNSYTCLTLHQIINTLKRRNIHIIEGNVEHDENIFGIGCEVNLDNTLTTKERTELNEQSSDLSEVYNNQTKLMNKLVEILSKSSQQTIKLFIDSLQNNSDKWENLFIVLTNKINQTESMNQLLETLNKYTENYYNQPSTSQQTIKIFTDSLRNISEKWENIFTTLAETFNPSYQSHQNHMEKLKLNDENRNLSMTNIILLVAIIIFVFYILFNLYKQFFPLGFQRKHNYQNATGDNMEIL